MVIWLYGIALFAILVVAIGTMSHENPPAKSHKSHARIEVKDYKDAYLNEKLKGRSGITADKYAQAYTDMIETSKDTVYVRKYLDALLKGKTESAAKIYAREIISGKSETYTNAYIFAFNFKRLSERYSRAYAQQIDDGEGVQYAEFYAQAIAEGQSDAQAKEVAQNKIEIGIQKAKEKHRREMAERQAREARERAQAEREKQQALLKLRLFDKAKLWGYTWAIDRGYSNKDAISVGAFYASCLVFEGQSPALALADAVATLKIMHSNSKGR